MKDGAGKGNIVLRFFRKLGNFFKSLIFDRNRRLITLSALLFCLAYPPMPLGFLAYFCLVPILFVTSGKGFKAGFGAGYLFGWIQAVILLYWVGRGIQSYAASADLGGNLFLIIFLNYIAPIGAPIALGLIQAVFSALLFGLYGWLSKGKYRWLIVFPFVWTSIEYIRTLSEFAFPWVELAYTQSKYIPMLQTASMWGDLGVGFILAIINLLIFLALKNRTKIRTALVYAGTAVIILLVLFIYGTTVKYKPEGRPVKTALIQANISLKEKFSENSLQLSRDRHIEMASTLKNDSTDLIIFAETVIREYFLRGATRYDFCNLARQLHSDILVGTFDWVRKGELSCPYNSAVQINSEGLPDFVHHKIRLVPFSEKIPYNQYFPFINDFHFGQSDFCMGDSLFVFECDRGKYAVMICFEIGFSDLNRRAVKNGAEFMVTITNDTWWGRTAGPYQHAYMVPFRAVENRRWYARCANTGFSFFCDPTGRIPDLGKLFEQMVIKEVIYTNDEITFYTRHGMWLPKLVLLFTFLFMLNRFIAKIVKKSDA